MRSLLAAALVSSLSAFAATRTETRKVTDFDGIDASGGLTLEVKKGETSVSIEGDADAIAAYVTEVKDGVLHIHRNKGSWRDIFRDQKVTVRVTTPALKTLDASGGIDVTANDVATKSTFTTHLSGGIKLRASGIASDTVKIDASGGVEATLDGKAKTVDVDVSGGTNLDTRKLQATSVTLDASGGCDVKVNASKSVKGQASGGVSVDVYGNPPEVAVEASGAASVERKN
jgi:hypothetical protein